MTDQNSKRMNQVLDALSGAQKSLENWQDQRTQAMISIDSLVYDVKLIQEEKNQILEEYKKCQDVFKIREDALKEKIESLTDHVQSLSLENDNLQRDLETSRIQTAAAKAEIEKQIHVQKVIEEKHQAELVRIEERFQSETIKMKNEIESKDKLARKNDTIKIEKLTSEIQLVTGERDRHETRARKVELELQALRTQLQTALNYTAATAVTYDALKAATSNGSEAQNSNNNVSISTATDKPPRELVQDYLKRLGY